jgi:hypothetical protein
VGIFNSLEQLGRRAFVSSCASVAAGVFPSLGVVAPSNPFVSWLFGCGGINDRLETAAAEFVKLMRQLESEPWGTMPSESDVAQVLCNQHGNLTDKASVLVGLLQSEGTDASLLGAGLKGLAGRGIDRDAAQRLMIAIDEDFGRYDWYLQMDLFTSDWSRLNTPYEIVEKFLFKLVRDIAAKHSSLSASRVMEIVRTRTSASRDSDGPDKSFEPSQRDNKPRERLKELVGVLQGAKPFSWDDFLRYPTPKA